MVERLIRGTGNFVVLVVFTLVLPFFCVAAWRWGSADEVWLMKVAGCILTPFCTTLWYIIASHLLLRRKSSFVIQLLVFISSGAREYVMLTSGGINF